MAGSGVNWCIYLFVQAFLRCNFFEDVHSKTSEHEKSKKLKYIKQYITRIGERTAYNILKDLITIASNTLRTQLASLFPRKRMFGIPMADC